MTHKSFFLFSIVYFFVQFFILKDPLHFVGSVEVANNLILKKLNNGACLHIQVSFEILNNGSSRTKPIITNATFMYGSTVK